jgi:OmpA-OmpF porin, OOP family
VLSKLILALAVLCLIALFILCPWTHVAQIAAMRGGANTTVATNTGANVNTAKPLGSPMFKSVFDNGKYRLTGTLPDEATKQKFLAEAEKVYGKDGFIDELKVGGVSNPSWMQSALALLPFTKTGVTNGGLTAEGNSISLIGQVPTEADKTKIYADAVKACPPNTTVNNLLTVGMQKAMTDEQAKVQAKLNESLAGKIIEFQTGSDKLTPKGQAILDEIAPIIKGTTDNLEVAGHTDNAGNKASNQSLSERRAKTVLNYLVGKGIEAGRFTSKGFGQDKPIAENTTEEGKQRNRRIEFQVTTGGQK